MLELLSLLLLCVGVAGVGIGSVAFGDIGVSAFLAGCGSLLSGIAILVVNGRLRQLGK